MESARILSLLLFLGSILLSNISTAAAPRCAQVLGPDVYDRPRFSVKSSPNLRKRKSKEKFVEESLDQALAVIADEIEVPDFRVILAEASERGNYAEIFDQTLHIDETAPPGVIAHELGHLVFIQAVRKLAPEVYALIKGGHDAEEPRLLDQWTPAQAAKSLVNAYAEQFCDLLAILATRESSLFAGSLFARLEPSRDWQNDVELPWENKKQPRANFPRQKRSEYYRMGEFRRLLWNEERESLYGSKKERRRILIAVTRAMTQEIATTWNLDLTDQARNQALIDRLRRELRKSLILSTAKMML